jgi:hypothetical protein
MKNIYPINPIIEVLNVQQDNKANSEVKLLLFTPLTKKQHDMFKDKLSLYLTYYKTSPKREELNLELKKHHNFTFADIIAIGDTKLETRLANGYIENIVTKTMNDVVKRNYKCFVNSDWKEPKNKMNLNYHDDGGCSWNCLMQKLKQPEYGVLFTIPIKDASKFNITTYANN